MITDTQAAPVVSTNPTVRQMALRNFNHLQKARARLREVSGRLGEGHTDRVAEASLPYTDADIDGIIRSTRNIVDAIEDTITDLELKVGGSPKCERGITCSESVHERPTKCDAVVYPVTKLPSVLMREELLRRLASELGVELDARVTI